jgi:glycosyltransferase involved in cell wall biosynthesis
MTISVLILTLDEEINIASCLESVRWCDDVVVLDSLSRDATREIARSAGARVVERRFDDWASHQNWAVRSIEFRHPWVLYLDADERCRDDLRDEARARATREAPESAFRIRRRDYLMGQWLRHAQLYPTWLVRLFRPERVRYERLVNPVATVDGPIGALHAHIDHYPFSHGVGHWIARHNRYSDLEAIELRKLTAGAPSSGVRDVLSSDPNLRRRALKDLFYRMPARPLAKFFYYYVWRRGFLDGQPGLMYSSLQATYEYFIDCKVREIGRRERGLPI